MNPDSPKHSSANPAAALRRVSWAWLNALAADLPVAACVVNPDGLVLSALAQGASTTADRLARASRTPRFQGLAREAFAANEPRREHMERLDLLFTPMQADRLTATVVVAVDAAFAERSARLLGAITGAVQAHLTQSADEDAETFDRVSSLHRLLHDAVERGNETDVVTAFSEAVFAWDGVEISGYVQDVDGQWILTVAAPGAKRGLERIASAPARDSLNALSPLSEQEAEQFGFDRSRNLLGATVGGPAVEPWLLLFAEGFGPLRESSARLYVDLLREALGRTAAIAETRAAWSILQQLLGAHDAESAATAALGELTRVLPSAGAAITATAPTGAIVLSAGDDEAHGSVRPFGRVSRLVANTKLADGYAVDLTVRRAPGETFTRREQLLLDRLVGVFGAWLSRALKQGTVQRERRAERRDFDHVLDRAAAQALRDGTDVSVMVISVPEAAARPTLLRSWVVELRSRMRGSDLAGALSDREIGLLLCGTTPDTVDYVSNRLCRHLKFGERGNPVGSIGIASRAASQPSDGSLVNLARKNVGRKLAADGGASR